MRPLGVVGNVNVDLILGPVTPWPAPGTEILAEHDEMRAGGAAGNVALAWRALGVPFQIAGSVGNDQFGLFLKETFGGVADRWPVADAKTTISVGLTHPDGERTFFTSQGHLAELTLDQVLSSLDEARLRGGLVLLCGSFLLPRLMNAYDALFSWAEERAVDIALDTGWSPGGWNNRAIAKARGWLAHCRHLLLNEVEVAALAGTNDPEDAARDLVACMPAHEAVVVVKRGPRGAIACSGRGELVNIRAMEVALIDTIGAGDIFNAAYLVAVASGSSLADAVRSGVETASVAISTAPRSYASANMRSEGRVR